MSRLQEAFDGEDDDDAPADRRGRMLKGGGRGRSRSARKSQGKDFSTMGWFKSKSKAKKQSWYQKCNAVVAKKAKELKKLGIDPTDDQTASEVLQQLTGLEWFADEAHDSEFFEAVSKAATKAIDKRLSYTNVKNACATLGIYMAGGLKEAYEMKGSMDANLREHLKQYFPERKTCDEYAAAGDSMASLCD